MFIFYLRDFPVIGVSLIGTLYHSALLFEVYRAYFTFSLFIHKMFFVYSEYKIRFNFIFTFQNYFIPGKHRKILDKNSLTALNLVAVDSTVKL